MDQPRLPARLRPPSIYLLPLIACGWLLLAACQSAERQQTASVNSLTAPLPTATPPPVDTRRTEPERFGAGSTPPDFALEDQLGRVHKLSDFRGRKAVVLVFYRGYF